MKKERLHRTLVLSWFAWLAAKLGFVFGLPWYVNLFLEGCGRALPRAHSQLWRSQ